MLDKNKYKQYGILRKETIKGVTIHNTGNNKSARELADYMANDRSHYATHFFVDEKETIQVMPVNYAVWHTGKGYDMGNLRTISIEICKSMGDLETYLKAEKRAIALCKKLMDKYNLTTDNIYFHCDFSNVYCPHRMLDIYKTKANFVERNF